MAEGINQVIKFPLNIAQLVLTLVYNPTDLYAKQGLTIFGIVSVVLNSLGYSLSVLAPLIYGLFFDPNFISMIT